MQAWEKIGLIYHNESSEYTHASVPLAFLETGDNIYRVLYTARNKKNQSVPFSLSFNLNSHRVLDVSNKPLLLPGNPGEFDSDGVMPTCLISDGGILYMFYIGWNRGADVPYRNSIGLAISKDQGLTFSKLYRGPVLDRSVYDPCFVASCDIMKEGRHFKMWYLSALKWEKNEDSWRSHYHIKYATATNLASWRRTGQIAIDFADRTEYAISTPRVHKDKSGIFKMWYSYRGGIKNKTYRIGYAESEDGIAWIRKDDSVFLPLGKIGWDSEMICYPYLFEHNANLYMLYNGNDYGKSGFGLAILKA